MQKGTVRVAKGCGQTSARPHKKIVRGKAVVVFTARLTTTCRQVLTYDKQTH